MTYGGEISRGKPGCFIFLLDQSDSMNDPFGGSDQGEESKAARLAAVMNRFLFDLTARCQGDEGVRDYFDVGVVGYGAEVKSAFSGSLEGQDLVRLSELADNPRKIEDHSRKAYDDDGGLTELRVRSPVWFEPMGSNGTPMAEALVRAASVLQSWLPEHQDSFPPIVINVTDGEAGSDPEPVSQSLRQLTTSDGEVLLFNVHLSSLGGEPIMFPDSEDRLPDEFAKKLFRMSSVLPPPMHEAARQAGFAVSDESRGFVFNADIIALITFLDIGTQVPQR